jgi:hypothetical protein
MGAVASYKGVLRHYESTGPNVRWYFSQLPVLIPAASYEVALAYVFLKTEMAHNRCLYCGVVKRHRADATVAASIVNSQHMTRGCFLELYENVFGCAVETATLAKIKEAEGIRDHVVHGKQVKDPTLRKAITDVLDYASLMNADLKAIAGFEPFGDLRGFKGRAQPLDRSTTKWLLKGMGFSGS